MGKSENIELLLWKSMLLGLFTLKIIIIFVNWFFIFKIPFPIEFNIVIFSKFTNSNRLELKKETLEHIFSKKNLSSRASPYCQSSKSTNWCGEQKASASKIDNALYIHKYMHRLTQHR